MTKQKSTKKTLLTSVLSLVLCMAMLIGTTFAWFTDSVTSSGNKIQAGTLKVDLEVLNKDTKTWSSVKDTEEAIFSYDNWEPGYTEVKVLKVENEGTLALKWHARLVSKNKMSDLANVIDVYVNEGAKAYPNDRDLEGYRKVGTLANFINTISDTTNGVLTPDKKSATLGLAFKMQESAGNEYQGLSLGEFDIQILATQLSSEADSFDIYYDENANFFNVWDGSVDSGWYNASESTYTISSAAELAGLAQLVNNGNSFAGKTVKLGADIDLNNLPWTPIGIKGNSFGGTFDGNGYVIANLNVTGTECVGLIGCAGNAASIYNVNIVNATVEGNHYVGAVLGYGYLSANSLAGCTVENATVIANPDSNNDNGDKAGVIAGMAINGNIYNNKAINSKVYAYRDFGGIVGCAQAENRDIKVYDNTVEDVTLTYIYCDNYAGGKTNQNMDDHVGRENPAGYKVTVKNNEGTANKVGGTASFANDSEALADAIESEAITILLEGDKYSLTNLSSASGKTIIGTDGTKVVPAEGKSNALTGTINNLTVKNITFEGSNAARWTYTTGDVVFEDCVFSGEVYGYHVDDAHNGTITFKNCEFIGFNGFAATGTYYFNSCKFTHSGSYGHTNMWGVGYFNDCTFGDKASLSPAGSGKTYVNGVEETYHHEFIGSAASLVAFADSVNKGNDPWKGQKVLLVADIDLAGIDWEPIGQTGATEFKGIFDGQGYTISNLNIDSSDETGGHYSSGLFGWIESHGQGITIKNVNVDSATVIGHHNVAVIAGYIEGDSVVENCNITGATLKNTHANDNACGDKTGVIAGYAGSEVTIKNCTVANSTVESGRDAGQLIGASYATPINCSANSVTVSANEGCTGANIKNELIGRTLGK